MENRRLVRPSLSQYRSGAVAKRGGNGRARSLDTPLRPERIPAPAELTNAEAFYYVKQMAAGTPMVVQLDDDERIEGQILWYDGDSIAIQRADGTQVLVFKKAIRYLYKLEDVDPARAAQYGHPPLQVR